MVEHVVGGKKVYVVESHHHVLVPWARHRHDSGEPRYVVSLDHHTDCHRPFMAYTQVDPGRLLPRNFDDIRIIGDRCLAETDPRDEASIKSAIAKLKHDEHVRTATATRIARAVFIISYQAKCNSPQSWQEKLRPSWSLASAMDEQDDIVELPPEEQNYPKSYDGTYVVGHDCVPWCERSTHNDSCVSRAADAAIETRFLTKRLEVLDRMAKCNKMNAYRAPGNYLLDIDLDYFKTRKAIAPYLSEPHRC